MGLDQVTTQRSGSKVCVIIDPGPFASANVTEPLCPTRGGLTPTTIATCPTNGGGSYQTMMSPGMGKPRCDGGTVAEGTSSQPALFWYSDQKSMALPATGKGDPASAKAPVTSKTHCRFPSCQSIQQPEPRGQTLAQKLRTGWGIPLSYQVSGCHRDGLQ